MNEIFSWDTSVRFFAESIPSDGGYTTRMHSLEGCTNRLAGNQKMVAKKVYDAPTSNMCPECTADAVSESSTSLTRVIRDITRSLARREDEILRADAVAARRQVESLVSSHPQFAEVKNEALLYLTELEELLPVHM